MSEPSLLILDDDQIEVEGIRRYAEGLGYEIVLAKSPQEAQTCNTKKNTGGAHFAVMIVDLQLGQDPQFRGGWEFLENAELNDSTVVVVLTKHADLHRHQVPLKVARRGLWTFKLKHDPDDLRAVRELLATQARGAAPSQALVAESPSDLAILDDLPRIAASGLPVLITGPSGSSKEGHWREIVRLTYTEEELENVPDLVVDDNCAGLSDELAQSLLIGHRRGSFTGANEDKVGLLLRASGYESLRYHPANRTTPMEPPPDRLPGTVILDEIAELRPRVQAMLLRALDKYPVKPVGDTGPGFKPNIRVIGLTNDERKLTKEFRHDLHGRLNGYHLRLPPITERPETAKGIVERAATSFRMLRPPEHLPQAIIRVSGEALEVVNENLGEIEFGARELIAWTHRACVLALWEGETTLKRGHMEEAWKRRIQLATDEPDANGNDPAVVITEDIRRDADKLRSEFISLFAQGSEALSSNWNGDEFREAYLLIKGRDRVLAARINSRKQNFTTDRREKLVVITAFRLENDVTQSGEPAVLVKAALAKIRSYFRKKKDGKGKDAETEPDEGD